MRYSKHLVWVLWLLFVQSSRSASDSLELTFLPGAAMAEVKLRIGHDDYYRQALDKVVARADEFLQMDPDPVVNKTQLPPSGDVHDYLSLGPYWWPDPDTVGGLPWIRRDGEVNPMTRGPHTDKLRLSKMFSAVEHLSIAYYYTDSEAYADKAIDLIDTWFVDKKNTSKSSC